MKRRYKTIAVGAASVWLFGWYKIATLVTFSDTPITPSVMLTRSNLGQSCSINASRMQYWKESRTKPPRGLNAKVKFLFFQPDHGGWNNVRMSLETAMVFALYTGRIFVLPPRQYMYLLSRNEADRVGVQDFYDFDYGYTQKGLFSDTNFGISTFEPFWAKYGRELTSRASSSSHFKSVLPEEQWKWIVRQASHGYVIRKLDWNPEECVAVFPSNNVSLDAVQKELNVILNGTPWRRRIVTFSGKPLTVDDTWQNRLSEILANRNKTCIYNEALQNAQFVYFPNMETGNRFLVHFYAFFLTTDWRIDLYTKRWIRDMLKYPDHVQCIAAKIVELLTKDDDASFDAIHVRRNDFQFEQVWLSAEALYTNHTSKIISHGRKLYIATDETNLSFFVPLEQQYKLYFLQRDFGHLLVNINSMYFGMIEQMVASQAETFIGTYFSTMSGYINRLRGYHAQKQKSYGYEHGLVSSYYIAPSRSGPNIRRAMRMYRAVEPPYWKQEFATAWRLIDTAV